MKASLILSTLIITALVLYYYFKWGKITIDKIDQNQQSFDYTMKTAFEETKGTFRFDQVNTGEIKGNYNFGIQNKGKEIILSIVNLNGWTMQSKTVTVEQLKA
ncbi:MAG: hypothetical protein A3F72_15265 [Bacteroidetes bacterium RIFCSPLOWO2_12_FULL_35_15]|nr:MAG: hypothetical protein A3F72_15265 [Bacteroidetes bacterium RIFCSPLOWO2_12_FULL_35_15]